MNHLILSPIFLITMLTTCFSSIIGGTELEELNSKKAAISEQYKECERRKGLQEYSSDPLFQQETEKLRTEADNGMADLAKAGYVEAYMWREKRKIDQLNAHRAMVLLSLEEEQKNLEEKTNGIRLAETSRINLELQDIDGEINGINDNLEILKRLRKGKIKAVRDIPSYLEMRYDFDHNISYYTPSDEDEEAPETTLTT